MDAVQHPGVIANDITSSAGFIPMKRQPSYKPEKLELIAQITKQSQRKSKLEGKKQAHLNTVQRYDILDR